MINKRNILPTIIQIVAFLISIGAIGNMFKTMIFYAEEIRPFQPTYFEIFERALVFIGYIGLMILNGFIIDLMDKLKQDEKGFKDIFKDNRPKPT